MARQEDLNAAKARIRELEQLLAKKSEPLSLSMIQFMQSRDLIHEWAAFHIESHNANNRK